jgi:hypothetical protein
MRLHLVVFLVAIVTSACGPTYQTVSLINRTDRAIEQIYIYPAGSANKGSSRATLAPNAKTQVSVAQGNVEVYAVSAKVRVDETTSDTRTASQMLELKGPLELVFHDSTQTPAGIDKPGTRAIVFRVDAPPAPPEAEPAP